MSKLSRVIFAAAFACGMSSFTFGSVPLDFSKVVEISLGSSIAATETNGIPALVRLNPNRIPGFAYGDFLLENGGDMMFTDAATNVIPHEVDTWNTSGESLVWVKLPSTSAGTKILMFYGNGATSPADSAAVWSDYVGVWHLGETGGPNENIQVCDSTANGYTGTVYGAETSGSAIGKIGRGWRISDDTDRSTVGGVVMYPTTNAVLGTEFTISAWMWHKNQTPYYDHVFYRKNAGTGGTGYSVELQNNKTTQVAVWGGGSTSSQIGFPETKNKWAHVAVCWDDDAYYVFGDGVLASSATGKTPASDNDLPFAFGTDSDHGDISWKGIFDEIRVRKGKYDANYLAAEYKAMNAAVTDIFTYGVPQFVDSEFPVLENVSLSVVGIDRKFRIVGHVQKNNATITAVFTPLAGGEDVEVLIGNVAEGADFDRIITVADGLVSDTLYAVAIRAENNSKEYRLVLEDSVRFGVRDIIGTFDWTVSIEIGAAFKTLLGDGVIEDFPVPVRLSSAVAGFAYDKFSTQDYSDLAFTDSLGEELEYEVDTWNPEGESLVWVKIPSLTARTVIKCYFGGDAYRHDPTLVWSGYLAVVHGGTTIANAAPSGLAVDPCATSGIAENQVFGGGINKSACNSIGVTLENPILSGKTTAADPLTFSAWFCQQTKGNNNTAIMFGTAGAWEGKGILALNEKGTKFSVAANATHQSTDGAGALQQGVWQHYAFSYDITGAKLRLFCDGAVIHSTDAAKTPPASGMNSVGWSVGSYGSAPSADSYCGYLDEIRIFKGVKSDLFLKAEHLVANDGDALSYGAVRIVDPEVPVLGVCEAANNADHDIVVSGRVVKNDSEIKILLTPVAGSVPVEVEIGTVKEGDEFSRTIGSADGLVHDTLYTVVVEAEHNSKTTSIELEGTYRYGLHEPKNFFKKKIDFRIAGYSGTHVLENFPVLLRISEDISGFSYADCPLESVRFLDSNNVPLAFDVDSWDASGTSFVWVSVPSLSGTDTTISMCYGDNGAQWESADGDVWISAGYKSVWHMNIVENATVDEVAGYSATMYNPSADCHGGTGIIGGDYYCQDNLNVHSMKSADAAAGFSSSVGTYSAWVRQIGGTRQNGKPDAENYPNINWASDYGNCGVIFQTKGGNTSNSYGIEFCAEGKGNQYSTMVIRDKTTTTSTMTTLASLYDKEWHYMVVRFDGSQRTFWVDGVVQPNFTKDTTHVSPDAASVIRFGSRDDSTKACVWTGDLDEMRFRALASTEDWLRAEYANVTEASFVVNNGAEFLDPTLPVLSDPFVTRNGDDFTFSIVVTGVEPASVKLVIGDDELAMATADDDSPRTYFVVKSGLPSDAFCNWSVRVSSTGGTTVEKPGPSFFPGLVSVAKTADAKVSGSVRGVFRISLGVDAPVDMPIAYTVSGTAVAGTDYVNDLTGSAVIPSGSDHVDIEVAPLFNPAATSDRTVVMTLVPTALNAVSGPATMTIKRMSIADYKMKVMVSPTATLLTKLGSDTVSGFQMLVKLDPGAIDGFDYGDFRHDGLDMMIYDENGQPLYFDIDTWNPSGVSYVWVKVPMLSASTALTVTYGGEASGFCSGADTWSDYVGVWHMNEASGDVADATGNGYTATSKKGASGDLAQMVAAEGVVGNARVNATVNKSSGNYMSIPNYDAEGCGGVFTFSAWYRLNDVSAYPRLVSRKSAYGDSNGWEVEMSNGSKTTASARGADSGSLPLTFPNLTEGWVYVTLVYNGTTLTAYGNGVQIASGKIAAATDNAKPLSIGNNSAGNEAAINGKYDEVRLRKGAVDSLRAWCDYNTVAGGLLDYSEASTTDDTAPTLTVPVIVRNPNGSYTVSTEVSENIPVTDSVKCVIGDREYLMSTDDVELPQVYSVTISDLVADKTYAYAVQADSTGGNTVSKQGRDVFYVGDVSIARGADAEENGVKDGWFVVSRADTNNDLVVNFEVDAASTAVPGQTYVAFTSPVVIPAGTNEARIVVTPLLDPAVVVDTTVKVNLLPGFYGVDSESGSATLTIVNLVAPAGYNTWVAVESGKASVASNWSEGRAPVEGDHILFDGRFTTQPCEWDKDAPHTVASWTQREDFTGVITIDTTFDTYSTDFTNLVVTGDVTINGGTLQQKTHGTATTPQYRLMMTVGGDFSIGAAGTVSVAKLGRYSNQTWGGSAAHGGDHASGTTAQYNANDPAFGDILAPMAVAHGSQSGTDSDSKKSHGGGALYLVVAGDFTNKGVVTADGEGSFAACGAGGSIYITAANIYGAGMYTSSVPAMGKTDGTGAVGSGGRIALVATGVNEAENISCTGRYEGWGRRGAAGTVYLKGNAVNEVRVKNSEQQSWNMIQTTTPIPAVGDTMNWKKCAKDVDLVGDWCAHLRLTQPVVKMNSLSLLSEASNRKNGNTVYYRQSDLDLAGKILMVRSVVVDGVDLKLKAGDYKLANAEEQGWNWLKDSSHKAAVEDDPETLDVDESAAEIPGTGILRVFSDGLKLIIR